MRLLAILIIFLIRLLLVWPLTLLWWGVRTLGPLIDSVGRGLFYIPRLLLGVLLWLLGSRLFLAVPVLVFVIPLVEGVNVPPGPFYGMLGGSLVLYFLGRKLWPYVLPTHRARQGRAFPPLPGFPTWPPYPPKRPRKPRVREAPVYIPGAPQPAIVQKVYVEPTVAPRPVASPVRVVATEIVTASATEEAAINQLDPALQQLIRAPRA